jgi:hypothetical protein
MNLTTVQTQVRQLADTYQCKLRHPADIAPAQSYVYRNMLTGEIGLVCPPITCGRTYASALHELGHVACDHFEVQSQSPGRMGREAEAWEWAIANAEFTDHDFWDEMAIAARTYLTPSAYECLGGLGDEQLYAIVRRAEYESGA